MAGKGINDNTYEKHIQSLTLDRTSVANGSPISGVLKTQGGLRSNLLLIDHDGMTYNLDRLLIVEGDTAKFNARIELDPGSRATCVARFNIGAFNSSARSFA